MIKHDIKRNIKSIIVWYTAIVFLAIICFFEYQGFENMESINELMKKIPKIVLAVFGVSSVDLHKALGYYSVVNFYIVIALIVYSIIRGSKVVTEEYLGQTYEFLYTKPISKERIYMNKVIANFLCILFINIGYSFIVFWFAITFDQDAILAFGYLNISNLIICLLFFTFSLVINAWFFPREKGAKYANYLIIVTVILNTVYDILENNSWLRPFVLIRYFDVVEIMEKRLNVGYLLLSIIIIIVGQYCSYRLTKKQYFENA